MSNSECKNCGGCVYRAVEEKQYRQIKEDDFKKTISFIENSSPIFDEAIFIKDGLRRRADLSFVYEKNQLVFGFNETQSHNIIHINKCPMLDETLNNLLSELTRFLADFCKIPITEKHKKKIETIIINKGSVKVLHADNGIDIILEVSHQPMLEHRLLVADFVNSNIDICRFSWAVGTKQPEVIVQIKSPQIYIAEYIIDIPQGAFLQASKSAENQMISKVLEYMGNTHGNIADLFCGLGTFTYPLAKIKDNEIISVDSFEPSLEGLKKALNKNQIQNVKVVRKNLFKYPFDASDLKGIKAIVIDPPRAGAHEQCQKIAELLPTEKPLKIIFVSCNPKTFVYDAQLLIKAGYELKRITLLDQFVYSKHQELIALFIHNQENKKGE